MKLVYFLLAILPLTLASKCECPLVKCGGSELAICQCINNAALNCYKMCGGKKPIIKQCPTPSPTTKVPPTPTPSGIRCGSLGLPGCPSGLTCINDPRDPTCLIAADCPGFCVKLDGPFCGGRTGKKCPLKGEYCVDDPRDQCDPPQGADCARICVFIDGRSAKLPNVPANLS